MSKHSDIPVPGKDLVQKLRPAYLGVPNDSPFDRHLLVWSVGDRFHAAFLPDVPESLCYRDSVYHLQQPYLGDWDPLLDSTGRLVGTRIFSSAESPLLTSDFFRRHKQLRFTNGELLVLLNPDAACEGECVQGVGTRLYADSREDYMFLFPQWCEWGDTGFPLASEEIPNFR